MLIGPNQVNRAYWTSKENGEKNRNFSFCSWKKMREMTPKRVRRFLPTNQDPTNILGRADFHSHNFHVFDFSGFQISRSPDFQIFKISGCQRRRTNSPIPTCLRAAKTLGRGHAHITDTASTRMHTETIFFQDLRSHLSHVLNYNVSQGTVSHTSSFGASPHNLKNFLRGGLSCSRFLRNAKAQPQASGSEYLGHHYSKHLGVHTPAPSLLIICLS